MEEEMWRQHSEDKRRRREEEAKRRRSEAARQERREGGGEDVELEGLDEVSRVLSSASHHHVLKIGQGATGEEVTSSSCLCSRSSCATRTFRNRIVAVVYFTNLHTFISRTSLY